MTLLQISDTHFGTEQPPVVEALVAMAHRVQPQLIVLSGDITQRARRAQFNAARRFLDRLPAVPRLVLPGNHDIPLFNLPARLLWPYAGYRRVFGPLLEPVVETPTLLAIGVNTTRPRRHTDGEVSATQIERVAQRLRAAREEQLRVVVTHQPLHVPNLGDLHNLLHGQEAAARAWAAAGADIVMGGHIHLPYVRPLRERHPDLPRELWCVQAGTAVSARVRRQTANSVNLLRHEPASPVPRCTVERWDYAPSGFTCAEATTILLDRSGRA